MRLNVAMFFAAWAASASSSQGCGLDHVIVHPTGTILSTDPITLEVLIQTSTTPIYVVDEPTISVAGDEVAIGLFIRPGGSLSPDSMWMTVEVGPLPAGQYSYTISFNEVANGCGPDSTFLGSEPSVYHGAFCVQEPNCHSSSCACPVFVPSYLVTPIEGQAAWARAINASGQVTGRYFVGPGYRGFRWTAGVLETLQQLVPGDSDSEGRDINVHGDIAGWSAGNAVMWQGGQVINLGVPGIAYAINDSRQVVGMSQFGSTNYAFRWDGGVLTNLTATYGILSAYDINNLGQIVGGLKLLNPDGTVIALGGLGGGGGNAESINDSGQVVGWAYGPGGVSDHRAFLWENGVMTDLGDLLGLEDSHSAAISNSGYLIGSGVYQGGVSDAFIYHPEVGLRFLKDLVPPATSSQTWDEPGAADINADGWITGAQSPSLLLTPLAPVPAASGWTILVFAASLAVAGGVLLRKRPRTSQIECQ